MRKKEFYRSKWMIGLVIVCFMLTGCQREARQGRQTDACPVVTFQMTPSSEGVEDFLKLLGGYRGGYDSETCYNVTPREISDDYGFHIFKFDKSCSSFLMYENKVYPLGEWFGGYGVTSFAVADLNGDGASELYFTFSWGSGIPRSQVGYFDAAQKETFLFDFVNWYAESLLGTEGTDTLCVYTDTAYGNQDENHVKSFVEIEMSAGDKIASITASDGEIVLVDERQGGQEEPPEW